MVCYHNCYLAAAFILATVFATLSCAKCDKKNMFEKMLTDQQKTKLDAIIAERIKIFWIGALLGAVIGYLLLKFMKNSDMNRGCLFAVSVLVVQYFFYILSPKQDLMVKYLTTTEQVDAWIDLYYHMQKRYHAGLATGIVAYYFIGSGLFS